MLGDDNKPVLRAIK